MRPRRAEPEGDHRDRKVCGVSAEEAMWRRALARPPHPRQGERARAPAPASALPLPPRGPVARSDGWAAAGGPFRRHVHLHPRSSLHSARAPPFAREGHALARSRARCRPFDSGARAARAPWARPWRARGAARARVPRGNRGATARRAPHRLLRAHTNLQESLIQTHILSIHGRLHASSAARHLGSHLIRNPE